MVALHIWATIQLAMLNKLNARPVGYGKKKSVGSSYASRTMLWSGPIIAAFVIYHLMQFTLGVGGTPFEEGDVYDNLIRGFQVIPIAVAYIVAMVLLCCTSTTVCGACSSRSASVIPGIHPLLKAIRAVFAIADRHRHQFHPGRRASPDLEVVGR